MERDRPLRTLVAALQSAIAGPGRLVLLSGEAGIGRSALIDRFIGTAARSARVLHGQCVPTSTRIDEPDAFGSAMRAELGTGGPPTVLIIEDAHWANEATLNLLRFLARRIAETPAFVIVSFRSDEIGRTHPLATLLGDLSANPLVQRVALDRLSPTAVATFTGGSGDGGELHALTHGNPFLLTQLLASPADGVPASVRAAAGGRLARLSTVANATVQALAVLGVPTHLDLLEHIVADARDAVVEAIDAGLLWADHMLIGFRHQLTRLAVLETVPGFRRVELHRAILAILVKGEIVGGQLDRIVEHAEQAGDTHAVQRYAPLAAAHATGVGAHQTAAEHYERALKLAGELSNPENLALLEAAAATYSLIGEAAKAVDCGRHLLAFYRETGDRAGESRTMRRLASSLWAGGRAPEARQLAVEAVAVAERQPPGIELAAAYANLAELDFCNHDVESVQRHAALAGRCDDPEIRARTTYFTCAGLLLATDRGWDELAEIRRRAFASGWDELAVRMMLVEACLATSRHDPRRAIPLLDQAVELLTDRGLGGIVPYVRGLRAGAYLQSGDWNAAETEARTVLDPDRSAMPAIAPMSVLGQLRARRDRADAWAILDAAILLCDGPDPLRLGPLYVARAEAAWLIGDDARAIAEAGRGLTQAGATPDPWISGQLAGWIYRAGGGISDVPAAEPYALEMAGDWSGAAATFDRRGLPYEAAIAKLAGRVEAVHDALAVFTAFGAESAARRARGRLRALGERWGTRPPRQTTRANAHGLTARQLEVAALLREDMTNAEIAARLFLSINTVNHHVTAVLAKLKVRSRTEVAHRIAAERGPAPSTVDKAVVASISATYGRPRRGFVRRVS